MFWEIIFLKLFFTFISKLNWTLKIVYQMRQRNRNDIHSGVDKIIKATTYCDEFKDFGYWWKESFFPPIC